MQSAGSLIHLSIFQMFFAFICNLKCPAFEIFLAIGGFIHWLITTNQFNVLFPFETRWHMFPSQTSNLLSCCVDVRMLQSQYYFLFFSDYVLFTGFVYFFGAICLSVQSALHSTRWIALKNNNPVVLFDMLTWLKHSILQGVGCNCHLQTFQEHVIDKTQHVCWNQTILDFVILLALRFFFLKKNWRKKREMENILIS